jgi:hypothetical protein
VISLLLVSRFAILVALLAAAVLVAWVAADAD